MICRWMKSHTTLLSTQPTSTTIPPCSARPRLTGFIWLPWGCHDPFIGFPAVDRDLFHLCTPIPKIRLPTPPPPLLLPFAVVAAMDKSCSSSSDKAPSSKSPHKDSPPVTDPVVV